MTNHIGPFDLKSIGEKKEVKRKRCTEEEKT